MNTLYRLLIVNKSKRNLELLEQYLGKEGYQTVLANTLDEFDRALESQQEFNLALVDVSGFEYSIWAHCEELQKKNIPMLIISTKYSSSLEKMSIKHGVRGVLIKPLVVRELIKLIGNLLESS